MPENGKPENENNDNPVSLLFLKTIVGSLGFVLVIGFVFVIGIILLGGKYFAEKAEFEPYNLARKITLEPAVKGQILSAKTSPIGVEVLSKDTNGTVILTIYDGQTGEETSAVTLR